MKQYIKPLAVGAAIGYFAATVGAFVSGVLPVFAPFAAAVGGAILLVIAKMTKVD